MASAAMLDRLWQAVERGDGERVRDLCARGRLDVNGVHSPGDRDGLGCEDTLLCRAAELGHINIVKTLVSAGAKVDQPSVVGTPLSRAISRGQLATAKFLLQGLRADPNARDRCGHSPLYSAVALRWSAPYVRLLVDHGADVNGRCPSGSSPLHWAIVGKDRDTVEILIKHGADVESVGYSGFSVLHWAVRARNTAAVVMLLEAGASPNCQDMFGETPLHWSARQNKTDILLLLVESGANMQIRNKFEERPYNVALPGNMELIKVLMVKMARGQIGGSPRCLDTVARLPKLRLPRLNTSFNSKNFWVPPTSQHRYKTPTLFKTGREKSREGTSPSVFDRTLMF
ncbi:PREDICTED: ankyrin repeat and protein kinase domain-containing protein 1-like [Branchiostoma belcheri]|uniref:Ankyrin repeat and protein kinase domain-containing protein 1-like n=1 Tax=Branchiostoma belcheri TaxID=7741 RepID=A0A6P4YRV4_BRABE|nr:PREDICTED: ankyrin repeat and protein kinase domain-containing protein 1-like [Branchiostoma belcheri]